MAFVAARRYRNNSAAKQQWRMLQAPRCVSRARMLRLRAASAATLCVARHFWHAMMGNALQESQEPPAPPVVLCVLAPVPLFHTFFRCLEILHHLLAADGYIAGYAAIVDPQPARPLPADLPTDSQAAAFLASLRETLSGELSAGAIVSVPLPPRSDYKLSPLPTIAIDVPDEADSELPPRLAAGDDFAELQIPPTTSGVHRLCARTQICCIAFWRCSRLSR